MRYSPCPIPLTAIFTQSCNRAEERMGQKGISSGCSGPASPCTQDLALPLTAPGPSWGPACGAGYGLVWLAHFLPSPLQPDPAMALSPSRLLSGWRTASSFFCCAALRGSEAEPDGGGAGLTAPQPPAALLSQNPGEILGWLMLRSAC